MSNFVFDIEKLFERQFGTKPYKVGEVAPGIDVNEYKTSGLKKNQEIPTNLLTKDLFGVEVWLPVYFDGLPKEVGDNGKLFLPYTVIRISGSSNIVRTPLAECRGSVKELFNIDDYKINIKGFFIDKQNRLFPEKDLKALKVAHEYGQAFKIINALTDIYLTDQTLPPIEQNRVVLTSFDLPEVEGGRKARPFTMTLESDSVFTLEVDDFVGPQQ